MLVTTLAVVAGTLFALGTFLVLRRDIVKIVLGLAIIAQGANVALLTMGGVAEPGFDSAAILTGPADATTGSDPLVQALVLTAIVIAFGMTAFALVLTVRVYDSHGTLDVTELEGEP